MDRTLKRINYLKCEPKHRVKRESLDRVREMTAKSGLLPCRQKPKVSLTGDALNSLLAGNKDLIRVSCPVIKSCSLPSWCFSCSYLLAGEAENA